MTAFISTTLKIRASVCAAMLLLATGCERDATDATPTGTPESAHANADAAPNADAVDGDALPAVIQHLQKQGLTIKGRFDAPDGLQGYAGSAGGRPISVYLTADGEHALIGTLIDAQGDDVGAEPLRRLVSDPAARKLWSQLEASRTVADGDPDAARVIYTFTDPNCRYCNAFWQASRPWVESGKVQLRHLMVGIIRQDSPQKAAAILQADDPSAALSYNELHHADGGIPPAADLSPETQALLDENLGLMAKLGFQGTPGIVYKNADGQIQTHAGVPQGEELERVLGPK